MEKLLEKMETLNKKQKSLMEKMAIETCNDIHSVLRSKQLAESVIELEIKKEVLTEAILQIIKD